MTIFKTTVNSPVGCLSALASDRGLRALLWPNIDITRYSESGEPLERPDHPTLKLLATQLAEYFDRSRQQFDVPLDPVGTDFQRLAWDGLRTIPYGTTRSYTEQAAAIGRPTAVRAVGAANARNPLSIVVPCHRVIGANGNLTGFAGGVAVKRFLLELETGGPLQTS